MSRSFRLIFFLGGLAAFAYLVLEFGPDQILANIRRAGWSLLSVVLVWLVIYVLNAAAWRLVLGAVGAAISFRRFFLVTVSGFVINYITPLIALGGEPYKVKALTGTLGMRNALSAVVLYRMVHLLGHMMLLEAGMVATILLLDLPTGVRWLLSGFVVLLAGIISLAISGHRDGVFQRIRALIGRVRFLDRASRVLGRYEGDLAGMDFVLTDAYRHRRVGFYGAVLLEVTSRALMGLEVYLILLGVGVETTFLASLFLFISYSIVINVLFFVPFNLGAREGGLILGLGSLALPPLLGVYLGVIMRIREFVWILLGLLFVLLTAERRKEVQAL